MRDYADSQRVYGLTAPGFRPRPRKPLQLPKDEYAAVMSAINSSYHARFEGQSYGQIAVGDCLYSFEISDFDEYRVIERKAI